MSRKSSSQHSTSTILRPQASPSPSSSSSCSSSSGIDMDMDENHLLQKRGKKRRLDHLSHEEKVQRKKLKNRVAAQTSRDRKKMKMDEMEHNLNTLAEENSQLRAANQSLREKNESLQRELQELRKRFEEEKEKTKSKEAISSSSPPTVTPSTPVDIALKPGSAASTDVDPLQQGLSTEVKKEEKVTEEAQKEKKIPTSSSSVWQVIALCLLYKICSKQPQQSQQESQEETISSCGKNWPKLYSQISPAKWQAMLQQAATNLPRMQAPYHHCLDSWWGPEQSAWNPPPSATPAKVEA